MNYNDELSKSDFVRILKSSGCEVSEHAFHSGLVLSTCEAFGATGAAVWGWGDIVPTLVGMRSVFYEELAFVEWQTADAQVALQMICDSIDFSCNFGVVIPCEVDSAKLNEFVPRDNAGFSYQTAVGIGQAVAIGLLNWAIIPFGSDAEFGILCRAGAEMGPRSTTATMTNVR